MSAYIMNDYEIDTIVSYFIDPDTSAHSAPYLKIGNDYSYLDVTKGSEVAKILMDGNVKSVNERYSENRPSDYQFKYLPEAKERPKGNIIGALDCLEYQSCEATDWPTSNALEVIQALRKYMLKAVADEKSTYTWGIE